MKKYLIAIIAVLLVAGAGLYFGNSDLFQGRIFRGVEKAKGAYVMSKDLCYKPAPPSEEQPVSGETTTQTPPERTSGSGTSSRGGDTNTSSGEEQPNIVIDPSIITLPGSGSSGSGTVAKGGGSSTPEENKYIPKKTYTKYSFTDKCRCAKNGEFVGETTDENGVTTKTICSVDPLTCPKGKDDYQCPEGYFLDWEKVYEMCYNVKVKTCYSSLGPNYDKDAQAFCKAFQPDLMAKNCYPSETCQEIIDWSNQNLSSEEMVKKYMEQGMSGQDAVDLIEKEYIPCLNESFTQ